MFKQSAKKIWMPAVWVLAIAIVGMAAIAGSNQSAGAQCSHFECASSSDSRAKWARARESGCSSPGFRSRRGPDRSAGEVHGAGEGIHRVFDGR